MMIVDALRRKLPAGALTPIHYLRYLRSDKSALRGAPAFRKPLGYDRIYFYHIRKTAGTSLAFAFMNLGGSDFNDAQKQDALNTNGWLLHGDYVFVTHNRYLIQRGDYFFGDAHIAAHDLKIPRNSFRITILRDPAARVISHYKMVRYWQEHDVDHPGKGLAGNDPGENFLDFLGKIPRDHLLRQLFMFSRSYSVDEAVEALSKLNYVMATERYGEHLRELGSILDLDLQSFSEKAGYSAVSLTASEMERLRELLEPEYALLKAAAPLVGVYRESR